MRDLVILAIHLIATITKLLIPGGARSIVSESLLRKHQLLILNGSRVALTRAAHEAISVQHSELIHR